MDYMPSGARQIRCHANRGRQYSVAFDANGRAQSVRVKCYTSNVHHYWRMVWNLSHEKMSTTTACAIRAALQKLKPETGWEAVYNKDM